MMEYRVVTSGWKGKDRVLILSEGACPRELPDVTSCSACHPWVRSRKYILPLESQLQGTRSSFWSTCQMAWDIVELQVNFFHLKLNHYTSTNLAKADSQSVLLRPSRGDRSLLSKQAISRGFTTLLAQLRLMLLVLSISLNHAPNTYDLWRV
jgi:hypothetical protein